MLDKDIIDEIKNEEENANTNEIVEIDENDEITKTQYDLKDIEDNDKSKKKDKKVKKPSKWSMLPKKTRIIIIVSIVLVLLIIIGVLLYFFVFRDRTPEEKRPEDPVVIVEKDNYRYEDGFLVIIDEEKNELGTYECTNKNEELCYVAYYSNEDDFDVDKRVYENGVPVDIRSDIFNDKYVFIYDNTTKEDGNVILYDLENNENVGEYELVKEINEEKVIAKDLEEDYGVLDLTGEVEEAISFNYDYLGYILESSAIVGANNNNYVLLSMDGEELSDNIPGEIKNFNSKHISVEIDGDYYIYNYEGIRQREDAYDYIRFVDNYIVAADNRRLYAFDSEVYPLNLEGVRIDSNSYNTELIFNDELVQVGKEEAFNAYVSGGNFRIEHDGEYTDINLAESAFNKNVAYVSYFQGKLYFYADEAKQEVLGSYSCSYANDVTSETTELQNCFIAKETKVLNTSEDVNVGYLPIYNERFVFITDTSRPNANDNIILYDLKNNKKLATYKEVDARVYSDDLSISFIETAGTQVVAYSIKNDSYLVINIESSDVTGVIEAKQDNGDTNVSVSMLGENYLFKRSNGTYHLYEPNGDEITENIETKNEIVDYKGNYILVNAGEEYTIYSLDGPVIKSSKYIILEDTYYITVDTENKIGVYTFAHGDTNLAEDLNLYIDGKDIPNEISYGLRSGNVLSLTYTINGDKEVTEIYIG